ncbi:lytic transglycosylase domain-containing protein [Sinimarinibacterium sp. CAU 1509]|uniref:lytic transglycosylase domain-containing protein n=1 Tax=Sinimarinibacterium sp. CAU 1509 TaxID=2562283 RepID=UPI0011386579|nr:lytic transglycosylase domain-containing protein [Sinimarinibacterium sp. CAU 1509]TJY57308.1 lytic transglycosylase domain-containing protein [Sinimarinibacterium sp. CAU 1509]
MRRLLSALCLALAVVVDAGAAEKPHPCLLDAADHYGVDWKIVRAIRQVEGGWVGAKLRNNNGTYDHGPMQINSIWTESRDLKSVGITANAIRDSECTAYWVGTWIYARELAAAGGDRWKAAGNYHSKTPKYHQRYLAKVKAAYQKLFGAVPADAVTYDPPVDDNVAYAKRCQTPTPDDVVVCQAWALSRSLGEEIDRMQSARVVSVPDSDDDLESLVLSRIDALPLAAATPVANAAPPTALPEKAPEPAPAPAIPAADAANSSFDTVAPAPFLAFLSQVLNP